MVWDPDNTISNCMTLGNSPFFFLKLFIYLKVGDIERERGRGGGAEKEREFFHLLFTSQRLPTASLDQIKSRSPESKLSLLHRCQECKNLTSPAASQSIHQKKAEIRSRVRPCTKHFNHCIKCLSQSNFLLSFKNVSFI